MDPFAQCLKENIFYNQVIVLICSRHSNVVRCAICLFSLQQTGEINSFMFVRLRPLLEEIPEDSKLFYTEFGFILGSYQVLETQLDLSKQRAHFSVNVHAVCPKIIHTHAKFRVFCTVLFHDRTVIAKNWHYRRYCKEQTMSWIGLQIQRLKILQHNCTLSLSDRNILRHFLPKRLQIHVESCESWPKKDSFSQ